MEPSTLKVVLSICILRRNCTLFIFGTHEQSYKDNTILYFCEVLGHGYMLSHVMKFEVKTLLKVFKKSSPAKKNVKEYEWFPIFL